MRLVRIGRAVWDVLAIADASGSSLWDDLQAADPSDRGAELMRATLATHVPLNGPPLKNRNKCRDLGDGIYEFKERGVRVLWFYDTGEPVTRMRIICTHAIPKVTKKKFQQERSKAVRLRQGYVTAKLAGKITDPKG